MYNYDYGAETLEATRVERLFANFSCSLPRMYSHPPVTPIGFCSEIIKMYTASRGRVRSICEQFSKRRSVLQKVATLPVLFAQNYETREKETVSVDGPRLGRHRRGTDHRVERRFRRKSVSSFLLFPVEKERGRKSNRKTVEKHGRAKPGTERATSPTGSHEAYSMGKQR